MPRVLLLGETVDVTMTVRVVCGGEPIPRHIVLVLDGSTSMAGSPNQAMRQAAIDFVHGLELATHPSIQVGVVGFDAAARVLTPLTNDENTVIGAINQIGATGGTRIDLGLTAGLLVLLRGRDDAEAADEVLVVLSDGDNNSGCYPVLEIARQIRAEGVDITAICLGPDCDGPCMRQVPGSDRAWLYYEITQTAGLPAAFARILQQVMDNVAREVTVTDTLGEYVEYEPGSAEPSPSAPSDPDHWLVWREHVVPVDGITLTYTVRPLRTGTVAVSRETRGEMVDHLGRTRAWFFNLPSVTVLHSETVPTPGETPGPHPTGPTRPLPTPIPTGPSPTPDTGGAMSAYLPWAGSRR